MECRAYGICLDSQSRGYLGKDRKVSSAAGGNLSRMHKTQETAKESRLNFMYSHLRNRTLVNNASAIQLTRADATELKGYDLMQGINARGTFLCAKLCLPHLIGRENPHVLTMAPPISIDPRWFAQHTAYTVSKFAMGLLTFGLAAEWRAERVAFNCLWPKTVIQTAALALLPGIDPRRCRKPEIVADAAHAILLKDAAIFTGRFCIDEDILREAGITDLRPYAVDPGHPLIADLFLE